MRNTHRLFISFAFCLPVLAGVSPIGMATSDGDIEIGRVRMPGPATLYDGATIETGNAPAQLSFRNGAIVRLGSGARATVHANSILLERGVGQVDTPGDYAIGARSLTVVPTSTPASARLLVTDEGALQVAALSGTFELRRAGVLSVGKMTAGRSLNFSADSAEAGAEAPGQFKGCLAKLENGFLLHEEGSNTIVALKGSSINGKSGDRVTVLGKVDKSAAPVAGASDVVQVLKFTVNGHGCSARSTAAAAGTAGAAGAGAAGAAGAAGGMSVTTMAIIGAAVAGAAVIPTVALTSSSSSSSISPSSR